MINADFSEKVNTDLEKEEQNTSWLLNSVLVREQSQTIAVLMRIHGLGTIDPSVFALRTIHELQLHQSCPLLMQSFGEMNKLKIGGYHGPIAETQSDLEVLKCAPSE
jgi:hypothetical protein